MGWPPDSPEEKILGQLVALIADRVHRRGELDRAHDRLEWEGIKARLNDLEWRLRQMERAIKPKKKPAAKRKARRR